jgi:hypothetical protein
VRRCRHQRASLDIDAAVAQRERAEPERRPQHHARCAVGEDERDTPARALGEHIPGGVRAGGGEGEREGGNVH